MQALGLFAIQKGRTGPDRVRGAERATVQYLHKSRVLLTPYSGKNRKRSDMHHYQEEESRRGWGSRAWRLLLRPHPLPFPSIQISRSRRTDGLIWACTVTAGHGKGEPRPQGAASHAAIVRGSSNGHAWPRLGRGLRGMVCQWIGASCRHPPIGYNVQNIYE